MLGLLAVGAALPVFVRLARNTVLAVKAEASGALPGPGDLRDRAGLNVLGDGLHDVLDPKHR